MLDALGVTEVGMLNDVQRLHAISHNLANAGTVGFKKEFAVARSFVDRLADETGGYGAPTMTTHVDHSEGTLKYTGNPLDAGLEGAGYFAVATPLGEAYTRQGNWRLDVNGRLVTSNGHPLLGVAGEIHVTSPEPRIDAQGRVWDGNVQVAQLRLVNVNNPDLLRPMGQGLFAATESTDLGESRPGVRQGFTESANVVAMHEMIKLMETVRHFEASQRIIRGYDAMLDRAINVGGEI